MKLVRRIDNSRIKFVANCKAKKADADRVKRLHGFNYDNLMDGLIRSIPENV